MNTETSPTVATIETRERILLVEDEPAVRSLFAEALQREGYFVFEARNGPEAIGVFKQHRDAIDLLLTDVVMPFMPGSDLAKKLRAERPDLKVLFISGCHVPAELESSPWFLPKPFYRDELLRRIRTTLDSDQGGEPQAA